MKKKSPITTQSGSLLSWRHNGFTCFRVYLSRVEPSMWKALCVYSCFGVDHVMYRALDFSRLNERDVTIP